MPRISIITRAYNRLEYTTRCVAAVRNNTKYEDYEHIIVNNASSDGTKLWINWISRMKNGWYKKVRGIHLPTNTGDFGGMKAGLKHTQSEYVIQLDNDIEVPEGWMTAVLEVIETTNADAVMFRRRVVGKQLALGNKKQYTLKDGRQVNVGTVPLVVACYIMKMGFTVM